MRKRVSRQIVFAYTEKARLFPAALYSVLAAAFFSAFFGAAAPVFDSAVCSRLASFFPRQFADFIPAAGILLAAAFGACGRLCARFSEKKAAAISAGFARNIRMEAFKQIFSSGAAWNARELEAAIAEADILAAAAAFCKQLFFVFFMTAGLVCAAALFPQNIPFFALCLLALPAAFFLCRLAAGLREKKRAAARERENLTEKLAALTRSIVPAKILSLAAAESVDFPAEELQKTAAESFRFRKREYLAGAFTFPAVLCAAGAGFAVCLYAGNFFTPPPEAAGRFFGLFFIAAVFAGAGGMAGFPETLRKARAAGEKLTCLMEREPLLKSSGEDGGAVSAYGLKGEIQFSGVSVPAENAQAAPVLDTGFLTFPAGQKTAIVSFNPESPACLLRVLARLREYSEGEVLIDGKALWTFDADELREAVDFVPGDAFLFEGTFEENIHCGRPAASDEDVRAAAAKLGRGDWLHDFPDGLDTRVNSGPPPVWAPLIQLARTLLKRPAVCLIEESVPAADALTEVRIQEALYSVMAGRTAVIAARRLSTCKQADRIIVFDKGRPVEDGTHAELLARGGLYAEICEKFFRRQPPAHLPEAEPAGEEAPRTEMEAAPAAVEEKIQKLTAAVEKGEEAAFTGTARRAMKKTAPAVKSKPAAAKTKPAADTKPKAAVKQKPAKKGKPEPAAAKKKSAAAGKTPSAVKAKTKPTAAKKKSETAVKEKPAARKKTKTTEQAKPDTKAKKTGKPRPPTAGKK